MAPFKLAGFGGGVLLLLLFFSALFEKLRGQHRQRFPVIFALANIVQYLGFLMLDKMCFDRYFLQLMPFVLVCLLPEKETPPTKTSILNFAAIALLFLTAVFSISATHDYLSWNRARWQALDFLTKGKGISPNRIDGGFEFNGWHRDQQKDYQPGKSWWWVDRDDYVVTFGELDRFSKVQGFPFGRWLPPGVDSVYVLKHD